MLNRNFFIVYTLIFSVYCSAQLTENSYFFDYQNSSYQMNRAISFASFKGNYKKSIEILKNDFFTKNKKEAAFIESLIRYNTIGKESALAYLESQNFTTEEKDFAKLWLSYHTNSTTDYATLLAAFKAKYPANPNAFKLIYRQELTARDKSARNVIFPQKDELLQKTDSILNSPGLSNQNKLQYSLMKLELQYSNGKGSQYNTLNEPEAIKQLLTLWETNKTAFKNDYFLNFLNDCETAACKAAIQQTENTILHDDSDAPKKAINYLLRYINDNKDGKHSLSSLESQLKTLILKEKNKDKLNNLLALINVYIVPVNTDLGFIMKDLIKPIPFTQHFKALIKTNLTKAQMLDKIKKDIRESGLAQSRVIAEKVNSNYEEFIQMSYADVFAFYGINTFSILQKGTIQEGFDPAGNKYPLDPEKPDLVNADTYLTFLAENPLYFNPKLSVPYPIYENEQQLIDFINKSKALTSKFPGSVGIKMNLIKVYQNNAKLISQENKSFIYLSYIQNLLDLFEIDENTGSDTITNDTDFYEKMINCNEQSSLTYFGRIIKNLNHSDYQKTLDYVKEKLQSRPEQKNLAKFENQLKNISEN
ncbi:hypothetical protein [Flavobacterium pedocola]